MSFGQSLSGLNAAAQNLDVIGNNIANSGTVGFKSGAASFADIFSNSMIGMGVKVNAISQDFSSGTLSSTGNPFDMAIDGEKGLFVLQNKDGVQFYTRNGQFFADKDNKIVNADGRQLMGYAPGGTMLTGLTVPVGNIPPTASTKIGNQANLDGSAAVIPDVAVAEVVGRVDLGGTSYYYKLSGGVYSWTDNAGVAGGAVPPDNTYTTGTPPAPVTFTAGQPNTAIPAGGTNVAYVAPVTAVPFDPENSASYSHATPITVYDSLGEKHRLIQYYTKRPAAGGNSVWEVNFRLDGKAPASSAMTKLTFDNNGRLISSPTGGKVTFNNLGNASSPAAPLALDVDYLGSTQFGGGFTESFTADGYSSGEYAGISIGANGDLTANYTNGAKKMVGSLVLADFNNLRGLKSVGGNAWIETAESGQPVLGKPGSNGLANIMGQAVEESNVDISQALVNMIMAQRTYQANAQTIKTQDQMMQSLMALR